EVIKGQTNTRRLVADENKVNLPDLARVIQTEGPRQPIIRIRMGRWVYAQWARIRRNHVPVFIVAYDFPLLESQAFGSINVPNLTGRLVNGVIVQNAQKHVGIVRTYITCTLSSIIKASFSTQKPSTEPQPRR